MPFHGGAQAHEPVESIIGPALLAAFEAHLQQGAVGGLDGSAAAEQPALVEEVVAQAEAVGLQTGSELGGQRGQ